MVSKAWFVVQKARVVVQAGSAADLSGGWPTAMNLRSQHGLGEILMSVQMVLLPVFVLVGLTFFLLLWMATARTKALKGRETRLKDIALGQPNWPERVDPDRQLLQEPVRNTRPVLPPDRAGAAAAPCRPLHRADVLGVRGDALRPCRDFRHLQQRAAAQPRLVCRRAGAAGDVDLLRAENAAFDLVSCLTRFLHANRRPLRSKTLLERF